MATEFLPHLSQAPSSRLPNFYRLSTSERLHAIAQWAQLTAEEQTILSGGLAQDAKQQEFIQRCTENALGSFWLPLGMATNYRINGRDVLIPMCTEEPSVVAAASYGGKLTRTGAGFTTTASPPITTAQIELRYHHRDAATGEVWHKMLLQGAKEKLLKAGGLFTASMARRGGGLQDITWKIIDDLSTLVLYLHVGTADAMGANLVNSLAAHLAQHHIPALFPGVEVGLHIVSNLALGRMVEAHCTVRGSALHREEKIAQRMVKAIQRASQLAEHDVFRATTHNKGIMNGIDAVALATGNDWRALEAGAHAYAAYSGTYAPLSLWRTSEDAQNLHGFLRMPLSVGVVGGMTRHHPLCGVLLKILGHPSAVELAQVMAAVGLGQNLAALRALSWEGIQPGHMKLHNRRLGSDSSTAQGKDQGREKALFYP